MTTLCIRVTLSNSSTQQGIGFFHRPRAIQIASVLRLVLTHHPYTLDSQLYTSLPSTRLYRDDTQAFARHHFARTLPYRGQCCADAKQCRNSAFTARHHRARDGRRCHQQRNSQRFAEIAHQPRCCHRHRGRLRGCCDSVPLLLYLLLLRMLQVTRGRCFCNRTTGS